MHLLKPKIQDDELLSNMNAALEYMESTPSASSITTAMPSASPTKYKSIHQARPWLAGQWEQPGSRFADFIAAMSPEGTCITCKCGATLQCKDGFKFRMYKMERHYDQCHSPDAGNHTPKKRARSLQAPTTPESETLAAFGFKKSKGMFASLEVEGTGASLARKCLGVCLKTHCPSQLSHSGWADLLCEFQLQLKRQKVVGVRRYIHVKQFRTVLLLL